MSKWEEQMLAALQNAGLTIATAESCTGGWLGKRLTDLPGSSSVYVGGVISYSNAVKEALLDVPHVMLEQHGAVSEPVARQMCQGVRRRLCADLGVGITGIAGPGSDCSEKPVGLVYIAVTDGKVTECDRMQFSGDREAVRCQACDHAFSMVLRRLGNGEI